jgi:hypothetical protein
MVVKFCEALARRLPSRAEENRTRLYEYNQFAAEILTEYSPNTGAGIAQSV